MGGGRILYNSNKNSLLKQKCWCKFKTFVLPTSAAGRVSNIHSILAVFSASMSGHSKRGGGGQLFIFLSVFTLVNHEGNPYLTHIFFFSVEF